jgi:5-formyltetrahydrofolate cyclo-ligase
MTAQAGDTFSNSLAVQRAQMRADVRRLRRMLPAGLRNRAARRAAERLAAWGALRQARRVAVYLATPAEISTQPLIVRLQRRSRLYAPVIEHRGVMRFVALPTPATPLRRRDALDLVRPHNSRPYRSPRKLDVVLVPLVAFDADCNRLGAGGGFYDRTFAFRKRGGKPLLIGYAFDVQRVDRVPCEPWDIRLDAVITERAIYRRK